MRALKSFAIVVSLACAALPTHAQNNPSVNDLVRSLKPGTTRGIKVVKPEEAPSASLTVAFATDSADLTPHARQTLDTLGRALTTAELAQYRFRIEGHTDTVGSPAYNKALSQRRADAVAAYLEKTFNIAPVRLEAVGLGQEGLAVPTPPQTANAQNRRVKVVNLGG